MTVAQLDQVALPAHLENLVEILKQENVHLKQGLAKIQANLAESVTENTENIANCRRIEDNCQRLA
jgi:ubiquinone biosynthesis protein UbiJ